MVLVDTSVWIRFLANRVPYAQELDRLLTQKKVAGHELVYGELLIGHCGGRRKLFLPASALVEQLHLWTADTRLSTLAAELGIAYERSSSHRFAF